MKNVTLKNFYRIIVLAIILISTMFFGCNAKSTDECYFKLDIDSKLKKQEESTTISNLRLLTKGKYTLGSINSKYNIEDVAQVDTKGLDDLNISGSRQYSKEQFVNLSNILKECAKDKDIYIIDLREESHGFFNGIPITWYKKNNTSNVGKTYDAIIEDENNRFNNQIGKTIYAYKSGSNKDKNKSTEIKITENLTEKEMVESVGFKYLRLPCTDHVWPQEEEIDKFISFVKTIDKDKVWLHFHCLAGEGRTGAFMVLYDMMKNPDVSLEDITLRQAKLGSNYLLYEEGKNDDKVSKNQNKSLNVSLLYQYIKENKGTNYSVSWSDWLKKR